MATRRVLLILIGVLSVFIVVGSVATAALLYVGMRASNGAALLLVGADGQIVLDQPGREVRVLAEDASPDLFRYPAIAPGGQSLAYISQDSDGAALHSLDLATGARTELYRSRSDPPLYVAWAPDGRHISFLVNLRAGGLGVHIVAADGSGEAELIGTTQNTSYFAWQPDGETLLLHIGGSSFQEGRVATYRPGSAEPLHQLVDPGFFQAPAWSVDGSQFFYVAQPPISGPPSPDLVESALTRVQSDGSSPQVLASEKMAAMLFLRDPQSDRIAYTTVGPDGFGALKLVDQTGGAPTTISAPDQQVAAFFWSPAGDQIAYLTAQAGVGGEPPRFTWHLAALDGGAARELGSFVPSRAFAAMVSFFDAYALSFTLWSPDGRGLVYGTEEGVYVLNTASGAVSRRGDGVLGMWVGD